MATGHLLELSSSAIVATVKSGITSHGKVLSILMYVFNYIESVIALPLFYQQFVRPHRLSSEPSFSPMPKRRHFLKSSATLGLGLASGAGLARERVSDRPDYGKTGARLLTRSTPLADGFRMPGEWERHEATITVFPPEQNWKGHGLQAARKEWTTVANTVSEYEPVRMVVDPRDTRTTRKALALEIEIIELPLADEVGHMNYYICNGAVIVPVSGRKRDDDVPLGIPRDVFASREVVDVSGRVLAKGGGGVHCITQQVPA